MKKRLFILLVSGFFLVHSKKKTYGGMVIPPVGGVVLSGTSTPAFLASRFSSVLNSAGLADATLAGTGILKQPFLTVDFDVARGLVIQPDNAIVIAGYTGDPIVGHWKICLVRYAPYGVLDSNFGIGGKVIQQWSPSEYDQFNALVLQPNGFLVAGGETQIEVGQYKYLLARYTHYGVLDSTFGQQGIIVQPFIGTGLYDEMNALALQSDGSVIAAGYSKDGGGQKISLIRYTYTGQMDASFGSGGIVLQPFLGTQQLDAANAVAVQSDGHIVIAGSCSDGAPGTIKAVVVRYTTSGVLDASFGNGGVVKQPFLGTGNNDQLKALVIQPDGCLVVAGFSSDGGGQKLLLMRYTPQGTLDLTFGTGGIVKQSFLGAGITQDSGNALVLQPDGKIVVVGQSDVGVDTYFVMLRYFSSGLLDQSFGTHGIFVQPSVGTGDGDALLAVGLQSDGKIVGAGYSQDGGGSKILVTRRVNNLDLTYYQSQYPKQGGFY